MYYSYERCPGLTTCLAYWACAPSFPCDFQFSLEISADARHKSPSLLVLSAQSSVGQLAACNGGVLLSRLSQL